MVYRKPKVTPHRWVLFNPLNTQTITAILGSLVLVTLIVCGLEMMVERLREESVGLEERNPRERRRHARRDWILTLDRALQVSGAAILSEASELQLRSRPARVLLCSWWLLSVVLAAAYSGTLTAFLSVTKETRLISSLEDLVTKQHDYKWGTPVVSSIFLSLQNSHKVHQDILHGIQQFAMEDPDVLSEDLHVLTQKVRTEDFVLIYTGFYMESLFDCAFEIVPVDIKTTRSGLVFPKGSALTKPFSEVILQLHSSGLLSDWTKKWFPRSYCPPPPSGPMVISLLHVQGVLLLLPMGLGLALGVMAAEKIYARRRKRKMIEETVDRYDVHAQNEEEKIEETVGERNDD
ncbi:glutamate receptor 3-like [Littorina saxatilis]|uniref:glutamate receptor 3-like n=1 Tax=Littorina saxatilis TaxID=31220 RepID=UPI0038B4898B